MPTNRAKYLIHGIVLFAMVYRSFVQLPTKIYLCKVLFLLFCSPFLDNPLRKQIPREATTIHGPGTDHPGSPSTTTIANGYTESHDLAQPAQPEYHQYGRTNGNYKPITVNINDNITKQIKKYKL